MTPQFFIKRPRFAWVVALFISMAGLLAIPFLPRHVGVLGHRQKRDGQ